MPAASCSFPKVRLLSRRFRQPDWRRESATQQERLRMTNCNTETPHRPPRFFFVLVPLLSCLLALGALELGLSAFHPVPFSIESNMYYEADPYTGFVLKPGGIGHFQMGISA